MKYSIQKEGRSIIAVNTLIWIVVALLFILICPVVWINVLAIALCVFFTALVVRFFRVPRRKPMTGDDLVIAPGDGRVVKVRQEEEKEFFGGKCTRISIYLSLFDVHATWAPVSGLVTFFKYHPGKYLVAWYPKSSSKNEHTTIGVHTPVGRMVMFRQIAGIIARRIICHAKEGMQLQQAEQIGFIKFGSRLDVFVPTDSEILVQKGDIVRGQQTVLARLKTL